MSSSHIDSGARAAEAFSTRMLWLRAGGTAVLLRCDARSLPEVLYWGADLGPLTADVLDAWSAAGVGVVSGCADIAPRLSLVPSQAEGWLGTPGLVGSRGGFGQFSAFRPVEVRVVAEEGTDGAPTEVRILSHDDEADLDLVLEVQLVPSGLLRTRATLINRGDDGYAVDSLLLALPVPASETQVIDQSGHHLRERETSFHEFTIGTHERNSRVARAHAGSTIHGTCAPGAGWNSGRTHYVHVAWSGNTRSIAERNVLGQQGLLGGELLLPGEVVLASGESYSSPWLVATWGEGFDEAAARIHEFLRARPGHPRSTRPVTFNAWEAVYFDHSLPTLLALVDVAADAGAERFVLDDGWYGSRRNDHSGLGDWVVSADAWPDGLGPLVEAVHARGMEFGLWFEPEMISLDSDAARAHPEWVLSPRTHLPQKARGQYVLDLTNPEAFAHVLGQIRAVLAEVRVDFIKWDFNRDLYEAVSPLTGRPAYHTQTLATYRLMDTLIQEHPGLEIESCAGGGGRIDLGVMERAVRVWASDCIDPLERQQIEAGTSLLLPPELVGSHVSSTVSHTTGRTLNLTTRASTAMFSHMGVEWNLLDATPEERRDLAAWIALHKQFRPLFHTGRVVHVDHPDKAWSVHGVVSQNKDEAIFSLMRLTTSPVRPTYEIRLPGLAADATYRLSELLPDGVATPVPYEPHAPQSWAWWAEGATLPGRILSDVGLRFPDIEPEHALLVHLTRV
ncbi:alpha-galactosidase [Tessaracoccus caeni]|uniref:alpha-galactosidase n=1 Tax=Tessaracoccus caeni TaxID=3031239 RepID=UPI0023DB01BF|nr:alpha-galactosidase [Tessaracoccus caeni]MDF1490184.1 alpha-galactosidase [Tessaracoccus caeni]